MDVCMSKCLDNLVAYTARAYLRYTDMGKRARATFEETCRVTGHQDLKQIDSLAERI
jgi:hypothetical protein